MKLKIELEVTEMELEVLLEFVIGSEHGLLIVNSPDGLYCKTVGRLIKAIDGQIACNLSIEAYALSRQEAAVILNEMLYQTKPEVN